MNFDKISNPKSKDRKFSLLKGGNPNCHVQHKTIFLVFCSLFLITLFFVSSCRNSSKKPQSDTAAISGKETYIDTGSSSVRVFDENGRVCIQQSNTNYEVINVYNRRIKIPLLLKIKKTELCFADSINKHKVYEISAKSVNAAEPLHWEAKFAATDLQFTDNTLLAIHEGVGQEEDYFKRFSLTTGEEIFSCSYGELKVVIPNVKDKYFVGFTSLDATSEPIQQMQEENLLGILMYSDGQSKINQIMVKLKRSKVANRIQHATPDMIFEAVEGATTAIDNGKTIILMKADEHFTSADIKDFSIKMTFYYGDDNEFTTIIIPVEHNRLDLAHALFDKEVFELHEKTP
ncbi:MAG: hypothetical protein IPP77_05860 [Bacteroidetes bacterium]|nr:hypothetical protein [Bacteroidota bacterium]